MPLLYGKTDDGILVPVQVDEDGILQTNDAGAGGGDANMHGYYDGAFHKSPLPFGLSAGLMERTENPATPGGAYNLNADPCPAGELWVITLFSYYYSGTPPASVKLHMISGDKSPVVAKTSTPVSGRYYFLLGTFILTEGDYIRFRATNATAGDYMDLNYVGYKMDIDL